MATISELEKKIAQIEKRNARVETDKAWETSFTRRGILVAFTYLSIYVYFLIIGIPNAWLNAIVPAVAFMLSTLTLPAIKRMWQKYIYKNQ